MTWTTPATPVTLTPITIAFYATNIQDNLNHLRTITGGADPGTANKVLVSNGASSAIWTTVPEAAMTAAYVNATGDTISGQLLSAMAGTAINGLSYANAMIRLDDSSGLSGVPAIGFHRSVLGQAAALYFLNGHFGYVDQAGTNATIWSNTNDGAGSGLDADTVDGLQASAFAQLSGATFTGGISGTTASFSSTLSAERVQVGSNPQIYIQKTGAGSQIGIYTAGTIRYEQTDTLATFTTPGVYSTSWTASSDRRLKSRVRPVGDDALELVRKLQPITYTQSRAHGERFGSRDDRRRHGFIAQEVRTVFPDVVEGSESADEYLSLDYARLAVPIVAAIQQLADRLDALESKP